MNTRTSQPARSLRLSKSIRFVLSALSIASLTVASEAQLRRGGGSPGGGPAPGGGGQQRGNPAPQRDPSPQRDPAPRREDPAPRREDPPIRREDPPIRREDPPVRREDPVLRREPAPAREEYRPPVQRENPAPRRETEPSRRDGGGSIGNVNRPGPGDTGSGRESDQDRANRGRTPIVEDRGNRDNPAPVRDRNPNTPQRDNNQTQRDRKPDGDADRSGAGGAFNRSRPGGDSARPDRDYRGEPYSGARGDSQRDQGRNRDRGTVLGGANRSNDPRPVRDRAYDIFSRSREGRQYNNGIVLRSGGWLPDRTLRRYFPREYSYYPYYYPRYEPALVYYSPYSYYYGVCAPYIYRRHAHYYPPSVVYIDVPFYVGVEFRSWRGYDDQYYLERRDEYSDLSRLPDRDLENAVRDLRESFRFNNISLLANLTDPSVRIAIFLRGKYEYSLNASDYLDMTRDMFATTDTVQFDIERIRRRSPDVWVVSGKQIYFNREDQRRTVYLSFVLERVHGRWTVTQVGTAPDRIEEPRN